MSKLFRLGALLIGAASGLVFALPAQAATIALPSSMASTGDSITRGFDSTFWGCFLTDCPQNSWSTGGSTSVNSQYLRILAQNPRIKGYAYNDAKTGAKMADLAGQLSTAAGQHVQYATVLMGANDVCASSLSGMTPESTFKSQFSSALAGFFTADPTAHVYVSSLPNLNQLYSIFASNSSALNTWGLFGTCQDVLPPGGTAYTRGVVYQQELALNADLQYYCGLYANCKFDNNGGFKFQFHTYDVSTVDYFHPSVTGQADIAALTWRCSYWGTGC